MMMSFVIVLLLIVLIPDVYILRYFLDGQSTMLRVCYLIPTIAQLTAMGASMNERLHSHSMRVFYTLFLCWAIPKAVFFVVSLLSTFVSFLFHYKGIAGNVVSLCVAFVVMVMFAFGYLFGWKFVMVERKVVPFATLPKTFDGYRVVHLSDFHLGTFIGHESVIDTVVKKVNQLNPDLIVFTGDLVNTSVSELSPFTESLSRLSAKDGVISVMGNHDYCEYKSFKSRRERLSEIEKLKTVQSMMGWKLLLNEHCLVTRGSDSIAVVGVENAGLPPFKAYDDLKGAMKGLPEGVFTILLSHDPSHWRREVLGTTDIELMLAGHTHGMQVKLWGFSPSQWKYKEWGGLFREGSQVINVSIGIGGRVPFRLGAWPEIDLLVLRRKVD
ncbi:MAG: metallophosphoesterase [Bacteroidaceae bacterium]|nr:metallophosphoesterase [Bacteroidaceae bacterium]